MQQLNLANYCAFVSFCVCRGVLETVFQRAISYVVECDGNNCRVVASGLKMANGITSDATQTTVYVVETISKRVNVYHRDADGVLTLQQHVVIGTLGDNIIADPNDPAVYYIGSHPKGLTFMIHAFDTSVNAPSQVPAMLPVFFVGSSWTFLFVTCLQILKMTRLPTGGYEVAQVYGNNGEQVSASTAAAVTGVCVCICYLSVVQVCVKGPYVCGDGASGWGSSMPVPAASVNP
jgi:hypothetical protein